MSGLSDRLDAVDAWIGAGDFGRARHELARLARARVERGFAAPVAHLARLAGLPDLSVRLLSRIVRPPPRSVVQATDEEKAEYAAALTTIGGLGEAGMLLAEVDARKFPRALLFQAFLCFRRHDFGAAAPHLERYVASRALTARQRVVGRTYLISAMIHGTGDYRRAAELVREVLADPSARHSLHLRFSALILALQWAVLSGNDEQAEKLLRELKGVELRGEDPLYPLLVRKWETVRDLLVARDRAGPSAKLEAVRDELLACGHWERARGCDFYRATAGRSETILARLYFGTPYPGFRRRILGGLGPGSSLPPEFAWRLGGTGGPAVRIRVVDGNGGLKTGQLLQRLLHALASDFYRPLSVAQLHEMLYPGTVFQPVGSANKIHQAVRGLRRWIEGAGVPLKVEEARGLYALWAAEPVDVIVPRMAENSAAAPDLRTASALGRLEEAFARERFSARQATDCLRRSYRSTVRLLTDAVRQRRLERSGSGPATRYQIC